MFRHSIYCVVSLHMLHSSGLCKLYFASFYLGLILDLCTPQGIIFSTTSNFILKHLLLLQLYKFINQSTNSYEFAKIRPYHYIYARSTLRLRTIQFCRHILIRVSRNTNYRMSEESNQNLR